MVQSSISQELSAGRRALDGARGIELLADFVKDSLSDKWVLRCGLVADVAREGQVPERTEWYVLVDEGYPWGEIGFFPSKENSITETYQHQSFNGEGEETQPWRNGKLCLDTTVRVLGRQAIDTEPFEPEQRLLWHEERALAWLSAASRNELAQPGEPFELPIFPGASARVATVAFNEGRESHNLWESTDIRAGTVCLQQFREDPDLYVVREFASPIGEDLYAPAWGQRLMEGGEERLHGVWLLLDGPPVIPPWQAPVTWGELRRALEGQGLDIFELLAPVGRHLRDARRHIALLGFPIPERVGDAARQIHWQPIVLPTLSAGNKTARGFRPNELGYWQRDRAEVLVDDRPLDWLASENWSAREVSRRGRLPDDVAQRKILVIGGGAIGSAMAELLVRGGVQDLAIMDGDILQTGNLVRHTLGLDDVGGLKGGSLADRLKLCSSHAVISGHNDDFPPKEGAQLAQLLQSQIVLDCTGSDEVLHRMELFEWLGPKLFLSVWIGIGARRLFCLSVYGDHFPHSDIRRLVNPWLKAELREYGEELPREGIGCWHPVFPARADDVWLMASVATKHLLDIAADPPNTPQLAVYEQGGEEGDTIGIRRVA